MKEITFQWQAVRLLSALALVLCLPAICAGQSGRGVITGVVQDSSGAVVPQAEITARNVATGDERKITTTGAGAYRIPYVPPGTYHLTVSRSGFRTAIRENIEVLLAQTVTVDFTLEVGSLSEVVTVRGESPLLEASTPEIGTNFTEREVHTLPIMVSDGTRQLQDFVFRALPGTSGDPFEGTINGGQAYAHEILIDGVPHGQFTHAGGGLNEFTPTLDAVGELKLHTGALSAQYGATQTAITNFGLKSGTNQFHGTVFWLHQNKSLNANSWGNNRFGLEKSPFLNNNFGATIGGPVVKDRTHFFFSYEGNRFTNQEVTGFQTMPTADMRQGNFSRLLDPAFTLDARSGTVVGQDALGRDVIFGQIYDPTTSRQLPDGTWIRDPFPNNIIPPGAFSSVSTNVLRHDMPLPLLDQFINNNPSGPFFPRLLIDNWSTKVDHVISENHKMSAAYINNDRVRQEFNFTGYYPVGVPYPGPAALGTETNSFIGRFVRFSEDWTISPTLLNHFAFGYNRFITRGESTAFTTGTDWASELGLENVGRNHFPLIVFQGFNPSLSGRLRRMGNARGLKNPQGSTIVQDDLTWLRRSHSLRFGFEHRRYYLNPRPFFNAGTYFFHNENTALPGFGGQTGFSYASFLMGAVRNAALAIPAVTQGRRTRQTTFYVQDDWKATPKLTLNIGLRWDIQTPITEVYNRLSGLDPLKPNPGADGFPGALAFLGDCPECTGRDAFAETYYRAIAPRIGFAWALTDKLVVRSGYGINYTPPLQDGFSFPYTAGFNGTNPITVRTGRFLEDPSYLWDDPYPPFTQELPDRDPAQLNGTNIGWYQPESNRLPYVQNWNFGIQYELPWRTKLEVNYVGNRGLRLNAAHYRGSLNQVDPTFLSLGDVLLDDLDDHPEIARPYPSFSGSVAQALRPFPQFQNVQTHRLSDGRSSYHSLQATYTKRSAHGLSFLAAYTFSKTLATSDSAGPGDYYIYNAQNFYNRRADYSVTRFHIPQDLKMNFIYDLPFGEQGRWARTGVLSRIVGGWSFGSILRYYSGVSLPMQYFGFFDSQALFNPGMRPDVLLPPDQQVVASKPTSQIDVDSGTQYLNPDAFGPPPTTDNGVPIRFGTAPRYLSQVRGFRRFDEDLSLIKRTSLGFREGANFEIRLDMTNMFNRTRIGDPVTDVGDPNFGRIFEKFHAPRRIQAGLRFSF